MDDIVTPENFVPLRSDEAEMGALGSMLLSDRAAEQMLYMLGAEDFANPGHRVLFSAIKRVFEAGKPMDWFIVKDELVSHNDLENIGGENYLFQVAEFVPSPANSGYYAGIVSDLSARRRRESAARKIIERVYDRETSIQQIDTAFERAIESKPKTQDGGLIGLEDVQDVESRGIETGFGKSFDSLTGVGWPCRQVSVVSAPTGIGKTNFMLQSAYDCVKRGLRVGYMLAADLNPSELRERLYKMATGWKTRPTISLPLGVEWDDATAAVRSMKNFYIYDWIKHGSEWETMAAMVRTIHAKQPFDILFVDYLQELETTRRDFRSETEQLTYIMKSMTKFAAKHDLAAVVGSQLTKMPDGTFMTKGARTIEEKAALIIKLEQDGGQDHEIPAGVYIRKNRLGPHNFTLSATFQVKHLRWLIAASHKAETKKGTRPTKADHYDPYTDE